jgi:hypothetical protein
MGASGSVEAGVEPDFELAGSEQPLEIPATRSTRIARTKFDNRTINLRIPDKTT